MANKVKETENKKKLSMVEISLLGVALEKGGKILDEMVSGKSILEYALHENEMDLKLERNGIKDGVRYNLTTGEVISIKGDKQKPKAGLIISKGNKVIQQGLEEDELMQ